MVTRPDPPLTVRDPADVDRDALIEIARSARDYLFLDCDQRGDFYSLDKSVSGADYIEHMSMILAKHALEPVDDDSSTKPNDVGDSSPVGWWVAFEIFVPANQAYSEDAARRQAFHEVAERVQSNPQHPGIDTDVAEEYDPAFAPASRRR